MKGVINGTKFRLSIPTGNSGQALKLSVFGGTFPLGYLDHGLIQYNNDTKIRLLPMLSIDKVFKRIIVGRSRSTLHT